MYWYVGYNYSVFASIVPGVLEYYVALSEHEESQTDCWVTCFWEMQLTAPMMIQSLDGNPYCRQQGQFYCASLQNN